MPSFARVRSRRPPLVRHELLGRILEPCLTVQLHRVSSTFARLGRRLTLHMRRLARWLDLDLRGYRIFLTNCRVNIMPEGAARGFHLHPLAFISGACCAGASDRSHVTCPARAGRVIQFESCSYHEVAPDPLPGGRISISCNCSRT